MKEKFFKDLKRVYQLIEQRDKEISSYYNILKDENEIEKLKFIDNFLEKIGLDKTKENQMSAITRLVTLRDDALIQSLKKANFSEEEIILKKEEAYLWVANFHLNAHEKLIEKIEDESLLTPFYRTLFRGVHKVGKTFSSWQSSWTAQIIDGVNRELYQLFDGDEEKIFEMLNSKNLHDKAQDGSCGDRSYSVLVKQEDGSYKSLAYAEAFSKEVTTSLLALAEFKIDLYRLEDEVFHQKDEILDYIQAIIEALSEKDTSKTIPKWAEVDRKWMKITTPLQIGHPLEYYEDHYKKAVALEWDLRISNPKNREDNIKNNIKNMYNKIFSHVENHVNNVKNIYENSIKNIDRVQLYLGRPALYYGAEFCGLFSAQVVPNDEFVTKEEGKKIFAFADKVLDATRAKPFMKIQKEIFDDDFLNKSREIIFKKPEIWHEIYNITTIGHEYGHILWLDHDTETIMNSLGNFKNIEEFKATTGGLVSFFLNEKEELKYYILQDIIKRAIGLIAWKETPEVEPYYCEGLIHLHGLFQTDVLKFDKKLKIDTSFEAYNRLKEWYIKTYEELAIAYLSKKPASNFLYKYVKKDEKYFMPIGNDVRYFVNYYWNLHKDIGQIIDDSNEQEKWLS